MPIQPLSRPLYTITIKPTIRDILIGTHIRFYSISKVVLIPLIFFFFFPMFTLNPPGPILDIMSNPLLRYNLWTYLSLTLSLISYYPMIINILFIQSMICTVVYMEGIILLLLLFYWIQSMRHDTTVRMKFFSTYCVTKRSGIEVKIPYTSIKTIRLILSYLFFQMRDPRIRASYIPLSSVKNPDVLVEFLRKHIPQH